MNSTTIFKNLWQDYIQISPSTKEIHDLFLHKEEQIINDHVAFRTFQGDYGIDFLAKHFINLGYQQKGEYEFKNKKLYAKHFEPPEENMAKVFISELLWQDFSDDLQNTVKSCIDHLKNQEPYDISALYMGGKWPIEYKIYEKLAKESEYAAWLYAFGYRANHFTVSINHLKHFDTIESVNSYIEKAGYELNASGGKVKGSKDDKLEQSSTKAKKVALNFSDGEHLIPGCYYEFAKRYPLDSGKLYQGFVAASADKIFESTDRY